MTRYRFVKVGCPAEQIICTDEDTGVQFCSYGGKCGLNKNTLDSAADVLQTPVSDNGKASAAQVISNQAGAAINDGALSYASANSYFKPLLELKGPSECVFSAV